MPAWAVLGTPPSWAARVRPGGGGILALRVVSSALIPPRAVPGPVGRPAGSGRKGPVGLIRSRASGPSGSRGEGLLDGSGCGFQGSSVGTAGDDLGRGGVPGVEGWPGGRSVVGGDFEEGASSRRAPDGRPGDWCGTPRGVRGRHRRRGPTGSQARRPGRWSARRWWCRTSIRRPDGHLAGVRRRSRRRRGQGGRPPCPAGKSCEPPSARTPPARGVARPARRRVSVHVDAIAGPGMAVGEPAGDGDCAGQRTGP